MSVTTVPVLGGSPGCGTGNLITKHLHSFEVYNDHTSVTTGEEAGPAGIASPPPAPVTSTHLVPCTVE